MANHGMMKLGITKLGKRPARPTPPQVRPMREYLRLTGAGVTPPPVPPSMDRTTKIAAWPMLGNDQIGDCTIAAIGHAVELWTAATGMPRVMSNAEAVLGYEAFGYRPGDESTDQGANAQDVLTRWTAPGFEVGGSQDVLAGFCALKLADPADVRAGVAWLGAVYAGLAMPLAAQGMDWWDAPVDPARLVGDYEPGSWGGHAVPIVGYGPLGALVVTWGKTLWMTWSFWRAYADEAYGLLSRDFASVQVPDEGWSMLEQDMADLRSAVQ